MPNPIDGIQVVNVTLTGSEVAYSIPDNVASIAFHCPASDITIATTSGGDTWTILAGTKESIASRTIKGQTIYFNSDAAQTLELMLYFGSMDPR